MSRARDQRLAEPREVGGELTLGWWVLGTSVSVNVGVRVNGCASLFRPWRERNCFFLVWVLVK